MDDGDPKQLGQNPLQDVEPDVRAAAGKSSRAQTHLNNLWLCALSVKCVTSVPCVTQVGMVVHGGSTAVPETQHIAILCYCAAMDA